MILLDLFVGFFKVGCFVFGGAYSGIPLIRDVVLSYGWLSDEALTYMIAVSESTPGPIIVNLATYVGSSQAGLLGALLATFAVVLPSFVIILLVTAALKAALKNNYVQAALRGMKPCVIGIVFAAGLYMTVRSIMPKSGGIDVRALLITALLGGLLVICKKLGKKKPSPIMLIVISAVLGAALYAI